MSIRYVYYALWIAPAALQVCLVALMWRRKLRPRYPLFFSYTAFQVISFAVQFYTYHTNQFHWFYAYWVTGAISVALGFGVIHEVFREVFRPFEGLRDMGSVLFRWAALVLVLAAIIMAETTPPLNANHYLAILFTLERSIRVMQCGLVILMLLCSSHLGLNWRHHIFGIALGFGIFAAVELVVITMLATLGPAARTAANLAKSGSYNLAVLLWIRYLLAPEPERLPAAQLIAPDRWDFALSGIAHPEGHGPSLPMIEHAVERVLRKSNGKNGEGRSKITNLDI